MRKSFINSFAALAVAALVLAGTSAFAQMSSAKGSAAISSATLIEPTTHTNSFDPVLTTYIKVPQQKELVFNVALQCGLYTDTHVKSKGGNKDTSTAKAGIDVHVFLEPILGVDDAGEYILGDPIYAYPGDADTGVTFASREQELMAKFQGIFQECEVTDPDTGECTQYGTDTCLDVEGIDTDGDGIPDDYVTTLDLECLDYEEVQLIQDTVSANAFNFIAPNLEQGEYKVTVAAEITSSTEAGNGAAEAKGVVGLGSMTVDEVRFIKGDDGSL